MPVGDLELPTIRVTKVLSDDFEDKDTINMNSNSVSMGNSQVFGSKTKTSRFKIGKDKQTSQVHPFETLNRNSELALLQSTDIK